MRKLLRRSNGRPSRAIAPALAIVCASVACNQLFDIDAPIHADSQAGAAGSVSSGGSSGGAGGLGSGGVGQGGGEVGGSGGSTGGNASGGDAGSPDTGGQGGSVGGTSSGRGGTSGGVGGATAGESGTGGSVAGAGGVGGAPPNGGMGGTSGDAGSSATAGAGGAVDPCALLTHRGGGMVKIPAGTGTIGTDDLPNTQPVHQIDFAEFCIDETEVTVAAYHECVDAYACEEPDLDAGADCNWIYMDRDDHPVTCVDWQSAVAFCEWAGKRLPTEKEWEFAARGVAGRTYPWGEDAPSSSLLNYYVNVGRTTPVGSYPQGATPDTGLFDMAGNVWEWTASEWTDDYEIGTAAMAGTRIARGGSFASTLDTFVRPSWRDPDNVGDDRFGFRCAYGEGEP